LTASPQHQKDRTPSTWALQSTGTDLPRALKVGTLQLPSVLRQGQQSPHLVPARLVIKHQLRPRPLRLRLNRQSAQSTTLLTSSFWWSDCSLLKGVLF
jgi:hypothetical protein